MHVLVRWAEIDARNALTAADRAILATTEPLRSLVLELLDVPDARDLWTACARLGALMAEGAASPSLASSVVDSAVVALGENGIAVAEARVAPARASLLEGYVRAIRDAEQASGLVHWEYPACAVVLGETRVAIACGFPDHDPEARQAWAARIAKHLVKAKVTDAVLSGNDAARLEVEGALALVGIKLASSDAPKRSRWLPW